jgi:hypothetical protein
LRRRGSLSHLNVAQVKITAKNFLLCSRKQRQILLQPME